MEPPTESEVAASFASYTALIVKALMTWRGPEQMMTRIHAIDELAISISPSNGTTTYTGS